MIQSVLIFVLGFLAAGLIAILIAPALQRRAERLTRRRIEATLPLSLNEIQAEKDHSRAEYAMITRRLEGQLAEQRDKANRGRVEIAGFEERVRGLEAVAAERNATIAERDAAIATRDADIASLRETVVRLETGIAEAEANRQRLQGELEGAGQQLEDVSMASTKRQIEIAERDMEIERLSTQVAQLRSRREESDRQVRERNAEAQALGERLKTERQRVADLETRGERLLSELSDRENKLERRDKTIDRLREQNKAKKASKGSLLKATDDSETSQAEIAALRQSLREAARTEEDLRLDLTQARTEAMRLEAILADLPDGEGSGVESPSQNGVALRSELADVAAQVVHLTRVLEGPGSPIDKFLDGGEPGQQGKPTLADRIRRLRDRAARSAAEPADAVERDRGGGGNV